MRFHKRTQKHSGRKNGIVLFVVGFLAGAIFMTIVFGTSSAVLPSLLVSQESSHKNNHRQFLPLPSSVSSSYTASNSNHTIAANKDIRMIIRDTLLHLKALDAALVWTLILRESHPSWVAMEVGMYRLNQCAQAAKHGLIAHCFEPSPKSFQIIQQNLRQETDRDVQARIHLYHAAVSNETGKFVEFRAGGSTGDHVGNFDVWNMKPNEPNPNNNNNNVVQVPTIRLDDVIRDNHIDSVYVAKIDTQGFEPAVISGLSKSLQSHNVELVLMEFWPAGIDMMSHKDPGTCQGAEILQQLVDFGYRLYALTTSCHPAAPDAAKKYIGKNVPPLTDLREYCQYFYQLERLFPSENYKMGYWSDILAVSPEFQLARPKTRLGRKLMADRSK
jgi:FkbM family methyltransferase